MVSGSPAEMFIDHIFAYLSSGLPAGFADNADDAKRGRNAESGRSTVPRRPSLNVADGSAHPHIEKEHSCATDFGRTRSPPPSAC